MHTNQKSNHSYIGFTSASINERLNYHINDTNNGSNLTFHCAIRKYGMGVFKTTLLDEVSSKKHAKLLEKFYIKLYNTYHDGYNMTKGGDGGDTISNHPDRISICDKIKNGLYNMSDVNKKRMHEGQRNFGKDNGMYGVHRFGEKAPMYGKKHTDKTKKKLSEAALKRTSDPDWVSPVKGVPKTQKQLETTSKINSRTFKFIYAGCIVTITNLTKYCKDHNLSCGCMTHVNSGRNKSHKGYTKYHGE